MSIQEWKPTRTALDSCLASLEEGNYGLSFFFRTGSGTFSFIIAQTRRSCDCT